MWYFSEISWRHSPTLVHYFQIFQIFLYVCLLVKWLTSLLKLDKYRDISSSGWDILLNHFRDIPGILLHQFQIILIFLYVCQSVSLLTSLLKLYKSRAISSSLWDIFLKFFGGIPRIFLDYFQIILDFFVCKSVY